MGRWQNVAHTPMRRLRIESCIRLVLLDHAYRRAQQYFGMDARTAREDAFRAVEHALRHGGLIPHRNRYVVFSRRCAWAVGYGPTGSIIVHSALHKSKVRWRLARAAKAKCEGVSAREPRPSSYRPRVV